MKLKRLETKWTYQSACFRSKGSLWPCLLLSFQGPPQKKTQTFASNDNPWSPQRYRFWNIACPKLWTSSSPWERLTPGGWRCLKLLELKPPLVYIQIFTDAIMLRFSVSPDVGTVTHSSQPAGSFSQDKWTRLQYSPALLWDKCIPVGQDSNDVCPSTISYHGHHCQRMSKEETTLNQCKKTKVSNSSLLKAQHPCTNYSKLP